MNRENLLSQEEVNKLLNINTLISSTSHAKVSLVEEIKSAILDSGKLSSAEWISLRGKLREFEELIPHIDLIIKLKNEERKK